MSNTMNPSTDPKVQSLIESIFTSLGVDGVDLSRGRGFKIQLDSADGLAVNVKVSPEIGFAVRKNGVVAAGTPAPVSGGATLDGTVGTATMVASTITVTVPTPTDGEVAVPQGATIYATVTTPGGQTKQLTAVRLSNTQIQISSPGVGYGALLESAGVAATLTAGLNGAVAINSNAGDRLAVVQTAAGGTPGTQYAVSRVNGTTAAVASFTAGNALANLDTSTVKVYNFGQSADETSVVRWAVIRP